MYLFHSTLLVTSSLSLYTSAVCRLPPSEKRTQVSVALISLPLAAPRVAMTGGQRHASQHTPPLLLKAGPSDIGLH
ncbi:hypothetical protein JTE90_006910 [Oedothorax gibbosus]|uniref:Secreted protein n=1 Tax=Oedothorax gibbosus TaxID=931172 RepID=A0AAV6VQZ7_9ARAC|nr:hypothetical protein JTE90_006910 [Oedothorax gibbosus]